MNFSLLLTIDPNVSQYQKSEVGDIEHYVEVQKLFRPVSHFVPPKNPIINKPITIDVETGLLDIEMGV